MKRKWHLCLQTNRWSVFGYSTGAQTERIPQLNVFLTDFGYPRMYMNRGDAFDVNRYCLKSTNLAVNILFRDAYAIDP